VSGEAVRVSEQGEAGPRAVPPPLVFASSCSLVVFFLAVMDCGAKGFSSAHGPPTLTTLQLPMPTSGLSR
jgi:hypothetical protein